MLNINVNDIESLTGLSKNKNESQLEWKNNSKDRRMVAINHSEADVGGRAIHVQAKPIEHLDEAGFQRLCAYGRTRPGR